MKVQKSIITLSLTLFALTCMLATNVTHPVVSSDRGSFTQFTKKMQAELQLTDQQVQEVMTLNQRYWFTRNDILNDANKVGQHTALLACWDKWQMELTPHLTRAQAEKFTQWQSKVDLLGVAPY